MGQYLRSRHAIGVAGSVVAIAACLVGLGATPAQATTSSGATEVGDYFFCRGESGLVRHIWSSQVCAAGEVRMVLMENRSGAPTPGLKTATTQVGDYYFCKNASGQVRHIWSFARCASGQARFVLRLGSTGPIAGLKTPTTAVSDYFFCRSRSGPVRHIWSYQGCAKGETKNVLLERKGQKSGAPSGSNPAPTSMNAQEADVLNRTNAARSVGRTCGSYGFFPAVPPVAANSRLTTAARAHAVDMGANSYFSHTSLDGSAPWDRTAAAGYAGGGIGENIAAGYLTPADVVQGWIDSPGHCRNLMGANWKHLGVGYAYAASSPYRHYWVQNFGYGG